MSWPLIGYKMIRKKAWKRRPSFTGQRQRSIDPGIAIHNAEQPAWLIGILGRSEQQKASRIQRIMKGRADALLRVAVEID